MRHIKEIPGSKPTFLHGVRHCEKYKGKKNKAVHHGDYKCSVKRSFLWQCQISDSLSTSPVEAKKHMRSQESALQCVTVGKDTAFLSFDLELLPETAELELTEAELSLQQSLPQEVQLMLDGVLEELTALQYHTHQDEGISICSSFLLGCCFQGDLCPQHHTTLPYHWQLRRVATQTWENIGEDEQEVLERLFCDPERVHITVIYKGSILKLDFTSMLLRPNDTFDKVRRLSTASDSHPLFQPAFKYYWKDDILWREYSESFVQTIEAALCQGVHETRCCTSEHSYVINIVEGYQKNVLTGKRRAFCCRPVFKSPVLLLPQIRTYAQTFSTKCCQPSSSGVLPSQNTDRWYPETWVDMEASVDFLKVMMSIEDRGYVVIYNLFHKSLPPSRYMILDIMRVQNPFLWDKYKRKKEYMSRKMTEEEKLRNERHLFHGTSSETVDAICKHNFDPRVCGKHATLYGQGSYFARQASYSHRYTRKDCDGSHHIFLSKVLVGKHIVGNSSMRRPPALFPDNPASDLYDGCVDNTTDPQIFVIFDSDQCYPYFIIRYKELENSIVVK